MQNRSNSKFSLSRFFSKRNQACLKETIKFEAQIILCGTHAPDIVRLLAGSHATITNQNDLYALRYKLTAEVKLNIDGTILPDTFFRPTHTTVSSYQKSEFNLQKDNNIYVVIASKDDAESKKLLADLKTRMCNKKITHCILPIYPIKTDIWFKWNTDPIGTMPCDMTYIQIFDYGYIDVRENNNRMAELIEKLLHRASIKLIDDAKLKLANKANSTNRSLRL